uniref:Cullin N-terminal domain-containing protein n=1 Tax=Oryza barthii TaxID=65489 RepID=A0A0D3G461_9ORYZ
MSTGQVHRGREGAAVESHGEDLLSVLPDEILLHIRSMLPAEAVARTRFLSRRWAKLPLHSTPPASSLLQQAWRGGGGPGAAASWTSRKDGATCSPASPSSRVSILIQISGASRPTNTCTYTRWCITCARRRGTKTTRKSCTTYASRHWMITWIPSDAAKLGETQALRWLRRFFDYLDRVSITWKSLHSLEHMGWIGFRDMVFDKLKSTLTTTVIGMINDERNGLLIDRALLKNVIHMCNEFGDSQLNSYPEYILKAEECLQKEKEQVYSHSTTEPKDTSDKGMALLKNGTDTAKSRKDTSDKGMALVKHGTDTAKSRKNKKNEVMVGFPINLISGSRVVDEILGRVPVKAPFTDSTFEFGTSSCNPPDSFGYIPTTSKSFAERLMAPENEDLVVMLSLDLAEELETIDEVYQQISRKGERGSSKLWKFIDHGVKKCTQIRRSITLLGGSPQEIPNYLIR